MASITFWGNVNGITYDGNPSGIAYAAGSGLGFYGAGYGLSVPVGQYQDSTWVTNANGTAVDAYKLNNTKWMSTTGVSQNNATAINLRMMPNYYAPLKIRFNHSEAVRVQNCKLRIFDRNSIENNASGVTTEVYEVRHPNGSESASGLLHRGTATHTWTEFDGSAGSPADLVLTDCPGLSGMNTSAGEVVPQTELGFTSWLTQEGNAHQSTTHDWYIALSASPDTIGSKTNYGLYFTCEYL